jgi:uncharacterized protein
MEKPPIAAVESLEALRTIYREASAIVQSKIVSGLAPAAIDFIARSPFVLVASSGSQSGLPVGKEPNDGARSEAEMGPASVGKVADGRLDVSPRGGPAGFVSVIELGGEPYVVLPDLNGNNLLDTFTNVVATGTVGMLFLVPGQGETLRVNGAAWISAEPSLLEQCTPPEFATPKAALVVRPDQVFIHCAKAFRRSGLWEPETWSPEAAPDGVRILTSQGLVAPKYEDVVRQSLNEGYVTELAQDFR